MDLTPRYSLKTARDFGTNFLKRLFVPKSALLLNLKFSKNKLKLRKFNPVIITVRDVISIFYTIPKIPVEYGVRNNIKIFSYPSFSRKSICL